MSNVITAGNFVNESLTTPDGLRYYQFFKVNGTTPTNLFTGSLEKYGGGLVSVKVYFGVNVIDSIAEGSTIKLEIYDGQSVRDNPTDVEAQTLIDTSDIEDATQISIDEDSVTFIFTPTLVLEDDTEYAWRVVDSFIPPIITLSPSNAISLYHNTAENGDTDWGILGSTSSEDAAEILDDVFYTFEMTFADTPVVQSLFRKFSLGSEQVTIERYTGSFTGGVYTRTLTENISTWASVQPYSTIESDQIFDSDMGAWREEIRQMYTTERVYIDDEKNTAHPLGDLIVVQDVKWKPVKVEVWQHLNLRHYTVLLQRFDGF